MNDKPYFEDKTMLTLDPVGLEQGVHTVMRDGDPICFLDLNWYPGEIRETEFLEYDELCNSVDPEKQAEVATGN